MSIFLNPVQVAVFNRLTGQLPLINIYDDPPNQPDGMPQANFPYITIGDDTSAPWDTDETLGSQVTVTLHVWSRYPGKKETKTILSQLYLALNRQAANLTATGYNIVDCLHEFSELIEEIDGKTRHGISRYRITMEKT